MFKKLAAGREGKEMTKALIRAIIAILELNGVDDSVVDQIRALIS